MINYVPNEDLDEVIIGHVNCNGKITVMIESMAPKWSFDRFLKKYWDGVSAGSLPAHWSKNFIPKETSPAIKQPRSFWFIGKGKRKLAEGLSGFVPYV